MDPVTLLVFLFLKLTFQTSMEFLSLILASPRGLPLRSLFTGVFNFYLPGSHHTIHRTMGESTPCSECHALPN